MAPPNNCSRLTIRKIENLRETAINGYQRLTAALVWEVANRRTYDLYFNVPDGQIIRHKSSKQ
jgi:hypothetical protein